MTPADQRFVALYIQRRRLMSFGWRENASSINMLDLELKALKAAGEVSQKVLDNVHYVPWR